MSEVWRISLTVNMSSFFQTIAALLFLFSLNTLWPKAWSRPLLFSFCISNNDRRASQSRKGRENLVLDGVSARIHAPHYCTGGFSLDLCACLPSPFPTLQGLVQLLSSKSILDCIFFWNLGPTISSLGEGSSLVLG